MLTDNLEYRKSEAFSTSSIIEYRHKSIVMKSILRKATGNITVFSFDSDEILIRKESPYDTLIQIIEGTSEIILDSIPRLLACGNSIIIAANTSIIIRARERFKMITTTIKDDHI